MRTSPATLRLKAAQIDMDGKLIPLSPAMNLTAEINTRKRHVIEFLLSPIQRAGMRAGGRDDLVGSIAMRLT